MVTSTASRFLRKSSIAGSTFLGVSHRLRRLASSYLLNASSSSRSFWRRVAAGGDVGMSVFGLLAVVALFVVWYVRLTQIVDVSGHAASLVDMQRVQRDTRFYRNGVEQVR